MLDRYVHLHHLDGAIDCYRMLSSSKLEHEHKPVDTQACSLTDAIDRFASKGLVQFFFEDVEIGFNIYVLDEVNEIEMYQQLNGTKDELITSLNDFYSSAQDGEELEGQFTNFNFHNITN